MIYSGPIPTFEVGANSSINNTLNGLVSNLGGTALQVALNPELAEGILGSPNLLNSIVTPGLISVGSQAITESITSAITDSQALGPFGPLVGGIAESIINNLTGDLIQSLMPPGQSDATRYFPGAGQEEEDADYGGAAFTPGPVGPDVIFSIKPAQNTASAEAQSQVNGNGSQVSGTQAVNEVNLDTGIPSASTDAISASTYAQCWGSGANSSGQLGYTLPGGGLVPASPNAAYLATSGISATTAPSSFLAYSYSPPPTSIPPAISVLSSNGASFVTIPGISKSGSPPTIDLSTACPAYSSFSSADASYAIGSGSSLASSPFSTDSLSSAAEAIGATTFNPGTSDFFNGTALTAEALENPIFSGAEAIGAAGDASMGEQSAEGWKFTTAPGDISWDSSAKVDRVQIFGTNQPPVVSGSRTMRDLTMSNSLIEGFSMLKSVEGKIAKLEALLNFTLTSSYVKVPVYWVTANDKKYGDGNSDGGYFVIKSIKVKEELRDLAGKASRAVVDVTFTQVPPYQVDDGRDIASKSIAGGKSILGDIADTQEKTIKDAAAKGLVSVSDGSTGGTAASSTSSSSTSSSSPGKGYVILGGVRVKDHIVDKDGTVKVPQLVDENGKQVIKYLPGTL